MSETSSVPSASEPLDLYDDDFQYQCEVCHEVGDEMPESCANCGLFMCRKCWGGRVPDDLYVNWCRGCADG